MCAALVRGERLAGRFFLALLSSKRPPAWIQRLAVGGGFVRLSFWIPFLGAMATTIPFALVLTMTGRGALIVLGLLVPPADTTPWLASGVLVGLLATYCMGSIWVSALDGHDLSSSTWLLWGSRRPGAQWMRWAHVLFVGALLLVHALGVFSYLPRTFLGGRPQCVSGIASAPVPGGRFRPSPTAPSWAFDRLCVLAMTEHDVVPCSADKPPAACVALKRDDVSTLVSQTTP